MSVAMTTAITQIIHATETVMVMRGTAGIAGHLMVIAAFTLMGAILPAMIIGGPVSTHTAAGSIIPIELDRIRPITPAAMTTAMTTIEGKEIIHEIFPTTATIRVSITVTAVEIGIATMVIAAAMITATTMIIATAFSTM
ncbi:MAG: hypothetical protein HQL80_09895 [Magnetococcales bacterium]|nr:hypothetical protein [Magnetococcales bacterium]